MSRGSISFFRLRNIKISLRFILAFFLGAVLGCFRASEQETDFFLDKALTERLAKSKTFPEIFEKFKEIQLSTDPKSLIGQVSDAVVTRKGDVIVADYQQAKRVYMFSSEGAFVKQIGGYGEGPGEYRSPERLSIGNNGDIHVFDLRSLKVLIFDQDGNYKTSFHTGDYVKSMVVTSGGIYLQKFPFKEDKSIFHYDWNGKLLVSFSPIPEDYRELLMGFSAGPGLATDQRGYIYQVTIAKYEVSKFAPTGELIKKFARTPDFLQGFDQKLPSLRDGPAFEKVMFNRTLIHSIFYLDPGLLLIQLINHDTDRIPMIYLEIYDISGNFIVGGIRSPHLFVSSNGPYLCTYARNPPDSTGNLPNPTFELFRLLK